MRSTTAPQRLRTVATDGHRLARAEVALPEGAAGMPPVIVPRKTIGELRKLIDEPDAEAAVEIRLSNARIRFDVGPAVLRSRLIDGTFPDYERVIPSGNDKLLVAPTKELSDCDRPRRDHLDRPLARGQAQPRPEPADPVGGQPRSRARGRGTGRELPQRAPGDRLQRSLYAGHERADRG